MSFFLVMWGICLFVDYSVGKHASEVRRGMWQCLALLSLHLPLWRLSGLSHHSVLGALCLQNTSAEFLYILVFFFHVKGSLGLF